jgi:hypothetical protein
MKFFRNKYLTLIFAFFYFFISCTEQEIRNKSFDYALYDVFKSEDINIYTNSSTNLLSDEELLIDINSHYGTNLVMPKNISYALENIDNVEDLKTYLISENLLTSKDIGYLSKFSEDIEINGFKEATLNFEENVLLDNVNNIEFEKYEMFVNSMKITNDIEPKIFQNDSDFLTKDPNWGCALAYVLFYFSIIGLIGGCASLIFCIAAWAGFLSAAANVMVKCAVKN